MFNILVVEDDAALRKMMQSVLQRNGYRTLLAEDGEAALAVLEREQADLIITDIMMPNMDGYELTELLRQSNYNMPILMVTVKESYTDKHRGFSAGIDDYMVKPFDTEELLARLEAVLRRRGGYEEAAIPAPGGTGNVWAAGSEPVKSRRNVRGREVAAPEEPGGESAKDAARVLAYKDIRIWQDDFLVLVGGQEVAFTKHEYLILELLMSNPKKVFTKANIYASVWNQEFLGEDNAVNVHISNLRQKLAKAHPEETYIQTVWGIGFKMG